MPRMIELIRASRVPSNIMQSAAKGALAVPAAEMVEILVYLASHTKIFAQQANLTLAGWDEASAREVAADRQTPAEVLAYLSSPKNLRPGLLPALLENPAVLESALVELAASGSRETADAMLQSARVKRSATIVEALRLNPRVAEGALPATPAGGADANTPAVSSQSSPLEVSVDPSDEEKVEEVLSVYLSQHASELKTEGEKPFQPIGGIHEEGTIAAAERLTEAPVTAGDSATREETPAATGQERVTVLQKITRLNITGRIQLAMKGTKEERSILVRDGTKLVALAVLDSPKISDGEVEKIAAQKNVLEAVLRTIPMKRRFMKNYIVVRNLVSNPRTPLDVALGLVKNLQPVDLKNLSGNKEVSDTVRKMALRMFKQKLVAK